MDGVDWFGVFLVEMSAVFGDESTTWFLEQCDDDFMRYDLMTDDE